MAHQHRSRIRGGPSGPRTERAALTRPLGATRDWAGARPPGRSSPARGRSSAGRAPPLQGGSRGFESPRLHQLTSPDHASAATPIAARRGPTRQGASSLTTRTFTTEERTSANKLQHSWSTRVHKSWTQRRAGAARPSSSLGSGQDAAAKRSRECLTKGQATKGARRMPRRYGPMKDVARLRKAPVSCLASSPGDLRMGQPGPP